jgi:hypothetical protein
MTITEIRRQYTKTVYKNHILNPSAATLAEVQQASVLVSYIVKNRMAF